MTESSQGTRKTASWVLAIAVSALVVLGSALSTTFLILFFGLGTSDLSLPDAVLVIAASLAPVGAGIALAVALWNVALGTFHRQNQNWWIGLILHLALLGWSAWMAATTPLFTIAIVWCLLASAFCFCRLLSVTPLE
ncbi:MAG: hypothetical protein AAGI52_10615 [Bacteroidota bacterium]